MTERDDAALDAAVTGSPSPEPVPAVDPSQPGAFGVDPTSTGVGPVDDPSTTEAGVPGAVDPLIGDASPNVDPDEPVRTIEQGDGLAPREALPDDTDPRELAPVERPDGLVDADRQLAPVERDDDQADDELPADPAPWDGA